MDFVLYLLIFIFIIAYELVRRKRGRFDLLSLINLFFVVGYIIVPLSYIFDPTLVPSDLTYSRLLITPLYVVIGYFSFLSGWLAISRSFLFKPKPPVCNEGTIKIWLLLGTAISLVMLFIYAQAFGGMSDALTLGSLYRYSADAKPNIEVGSSATALYFVGFSKITFLYCFYRIISKAGRNSLLFWVVLIVSGIIIFTFSVIHGSRGSIVGIFIVSFLIVLLTSKRFPIVSTLGLVFFVVIMIASGKNLISVVSNYFETGRINYSIVVERDADYVTRRILKEFTHPVVSLEKAIDTVGVKLEYTYMVHFPTAIMHLIPSKLFDLAFEKPKTISYINSINLVGYNKGLPPGILGSFYYGFGLLGIIIGMFLFGLTARILQNTLYRWMMLYPGMLPLSVLLFYNFAQFVSSGDMKVMLQGNFYLLIALLAMFVSLRIRQSIQKQKRRPVVASTMNTGSTRNRVGKY